MKENERLIDFEETLELLEKKGFPISRNTVYRLHSEKKFVQGIMIKNRLFFTPTDVTHWAQRNLAIKNNHFKVGI